MANIYRVLSKCQAYYRHQHLASCLISLTTLRGWHPILWMSDRSVGKAAQGHTARKGEARLETWGAWVLHIMQTVLHPATRGVTAQNKPYQVTPPSPNPPVAPYCPWAGDQVPSHCVPRSRLLHPPFASHSPWLSAKGCTGLFCSQNTPPSCSCQRAVAPAVSSAWSAHRNLPSIHPCLVNSVSSKHLLWEAHPDCHSWSTPPLFLLCRMDHVATFLLFIHINSYLCLCE